MGQENRGLEDCRKEQVMTNYTASKLLGVSVDEYRVMMSDPHPNESMFKCTELIELILNDEESTD